MEKVKLLGVDICAVNMAQTLAEVDRWIDANETQMVCVTPVHAVMDCYDNPELRQIYNEAGITTPDGMPVVWWLKWHGKKWVERVYGPDLMLALCDHSLERGYRHFLYGGTQDALQKLEKILTERFPGLIICGSHSPPFRELTEAEDEVICEMIQHTEADIVWVGIGSPRQEMWMKAHLNQLNAPVLIGVGAAFDFISGEKIQAPLWIQRSGLEWLFRLVSEPGRLWKRYLLGYPRFLCLLLLEQMGIIKVGK